MASSSSARPHSTPMPVGPSILWPDDLGPRAWAMAWACATWRGPQGAFDEGTLVTRPKMVLVSVRRSPSGAPGLTDPVAELLSGRERRGRRSRPPPPDGDERFEEAVHTARRDEGELSVHRFGDLWIATEADMLGDVVELTYGYRVGGRSIRTPSAPGHVDAYAYGSRWPCRSTASTRSRARLEVVIFIRRPSGGSLPPEELGKIVGRDLADPASGTPRHRRGRAEAAEIAAAEAGRIPNLTAVVVDRERAEARAARGGPCWPRGSSV